MTELAYAPALNPPDREIAPPTTSAVRQEIEILRLLCALGIVWLHAGVLGSHVGMAGSVVFAALSVYLSGTKKTVLQRGQRLLIPWVLWSLVYGAVAIAQSRPPLNFDNGVIAGILRGPAYHLWYLPFIFTVLIILAPYKRKVSPQVQAWTGAVGALASLLTFRFWFPESESWDLPWSHYVRILPAAFFGLFLSRAGKLSRWHGRSMMVLIWLATLTLPSAGIGLAYKVGFAVAIVALLWPPRFPIKVDARPWSRCTMGIYLLHPLLLMALIPYRDSLSVLMPMIAFAGSAILVRLALLSPWAARYALGATQ